MTPHTCPQCGALLEHDEAISSTSIECTVSCSCGYHASVEPDAETIHTLNAIREFRTIEC